MNLNKIFQNKQIDRNHWIVWEGDTFEIVSKKPRDPCQNRETLARFYSACTQSIEKLGASARQASQSMRAFWIEESMPKRPKILPRIIGEDGFLRMYALGLPLTVDLFCRIWKKIGEPLETKTIELEPIFVEWNPPSEHFYDVNTMPPGLLPKLFKSWRIKKDEELLQKVASDLEGISRFNDPIKREWLTLAVLSHSVSYREMEGREISIPSFQTRGEMIPCKCYQHLIEKGLKTLSLVPQVEGARAIYLCQGTEVWPSQPSVLGSLLANFAMHGSATEAYAHSWRRIHKHLRDLPGELPLIGGHSMGGALAIQIGLYSHNLIGRAYAFNPPLPNERDYAFYHQMSEESKEKIRLIANLDDFAFWRMGSKVIGNVTLFLSKTRWKYYAVSIWDCLLFLPAIVKFILNVHHAFPAHQNIAALYENWISVRLTQSEIEKENNERITRFDYLRFLPKLYDPMQALLHFVRRIFRWSLEEDYLINEIEILALHERDLLDTLTEENKEQIEKELHMLHAQKEALIRRLTPV